MEETHPTKNNETRQKEPPLYGENGNSITSITGKLQIMTSNSKKNSIKNLTITHIPLCLMSNGGGAKIRIYQTYPEKSSDDEKNNASNHIWRNDWELGK